MRPSILALVAATLLALTGCGNPHQARTVTEFEHNHPYAKRTNTTQFTPEQNHGQNWLTYRDRFPRAGFNGNYEVENRIYILTVKADGETVTSVAHGIEW